MEAQIRSTMHSAMRDLLTDTLSKHSLTSHDIGWIRSLCNELVDRLNSLTLHRLDLHDRLRRQFDVELIIQMVVNDAFEGSDAVHASNAILGRIAILCAPSQDAKVACLQADVADGKCDIGRLILESHLLIDEIEELSKSATSQSAAEMWRRNAQK